MDPDEEEEAQEVAFGARYGDRASLFFVFSRLSSLVLLLSLSFSFSHFSRFAGSVVLWSTLISGSQHGFGPSQY